jgi:peptidoglycan-associated lipoprotein
MTKIFTALMVLTLAFQITNCSSKKKSDLSPDGGDPLAQGGVLDATNMTDSPMGAGATGSDTGSITGLNTINFAYDNSSLSESAKQTLKNNAAWMNANPNVNVQIEGHCDERGSVEYNLALGERRAKAVKDYLQSIGVNPSQMMTISYGEEKLLSYGDTESDHVKNRRANFLPLQ